METIKVMETKELLVYSCGYCGKLFRDKKSADECHADKSCDKCGKIIGKKDYYSQCPDCRREARVQKEKELFDKAEKMTYEEYVDKFPGYPTVSDGDSYFWDYYDIESYFDEIPTYVWGTDKTTKCLDYGSIAEQFEEDCELEEFRLDEEAVRDLKQFCENWNHKHSQDVYFQNNKLVVLL